jgi:hypothetical protein
MTQAEQDQQYGEVIRQIREQEKALAPLLVEAQNIGNRLLTLAQSFQREFGVRKIGDKYTGWISGAHAIDGYENILDFGKLMKIEDDIRERGRELDRLYRLRSQLDNA